jgi:hypothetical protein
MAHASGIFSVMALLLLDCVLPHRKCSGMQQMSERQCSSPLGPLPALFLSPTLCCLISPSLEGLSPGRPHLCRQAAPPIAYDSSGHWQEDLQEGEAEQGQLQSLDVDLRGDRRETG